jgi:hypothetical protein
MMKGGETVATRKTKAELENDVKNLQAQLQEAKGGKAQVHLTDLIDVPLEVPAGASVPGKGGVGGDVMGFVKQLLTGRGDTEPGEQIHGPSAWKFNMKFFVDFIAMLGSLYAFQGFGANQIQMNAQSTILNKILGDMAEPANKMMPSQMVGHRDLAVTSQFTIFPESDLFLTKIAETFSRKYGGTVEGWKGSLAEAVEKVKAAKGIVEKE